MKTTRLMVLVLLALAIVMTFVSCDLNKDPREALTGKWGRSYYNSDKGYTEFEVLEFNADDIMGLLRTHYYPSIAPTLDSGANYRYEIMGKKLIQKAWIGDDSLEYEYAIKGNKLSITRNGITTEFTKNYVEE